MYIYTVVIIIIIGILLVLVSAKPSLRKESSKLGLNSLKGENNTSSGELPLPPDNSSSHEHPPPKPTDDGTKEPPPPPPPPHPTGERPIGERPTGDPPHPPHPDHHDHHHDGEHPPPHPDEEGGERREGKLGGYNQRPNGEHHLQHAEGRDEELGMKQSRFGKNKSNFNGNLRDEGRSRRW